MSHSPPLRRILVFATLLLGGCTAGAAAQADCEWCGLPDAPRTIGWQTVIAPRGEPGVPLVIEGRVRDARGAAVTGAIVYAYHTNARGRYPTRGDETGNGRRHGYLRGWTRTDADGRYRFVTIRPEPYPMRPSFLAEPAHVHLSLTLPGGAETLVDAIHFDDDPLLTPAMRARMPNAGGSGIVRLRRGAADTLVAERPITAGTR